MIKKIYSIPEAGIVTMAIVLALLFYMINPVFLTTGNIAGMLRAMSYTGIVAVGLAICLISGTIDLSVGAVAGLSSVIFAKLVVSGMSIPFACICTLLAGIAAGAINSFVIIYMRVTPFIATISSMYVFRGLANFISGGFTIYPLPDVVPAFGASQPLGISPAFLFMIGTMFVFSILLKFTVWGLCVRATGSDVETAECTEVPVKLIQISALVIVAVLASISGMFTTSVLGAGTPSAGTGWELVAIAGCAIGGVSLFGYSGSMVGLFFGLLTMQIISTGIITVGVSPYLQNVTVGIILMASMIVEVRRRYFLNLERI